MDLPINLSAEYSPLIKNLFHLFIGLAFGFVLEQSGFGNSRKLAAQFYFKDLTVLKVMFSAIITSMILIFAFSGLGFLDYTSIWVNPTYLGPGIIGGLIMGFGFIIGGFCPGTSLVSAATLKLDGIFFVLGALFGAFLFGETVDHFAQLWNSGYYGRLTLSDVFQVGSGIIAFLVVAGAMLAFKAGERAEEKFSQGKVKKRLPLWGVGAYLIVSLLVLIIGYPSPAERWEKVAPKYEQVLKDRSIYVHPGEVAKLYYDDNVDLRIWDFRTQEKFNTFHIQGAEIMSLDTLKEKFILGLQKLSPNTAIILADCKEENSLKAWQLLKAYNTPNVFIMEGGVDNWLQVFQAHHEFASAAQDTSCKRWDIKEYKGKMHHGSEIPEEAVKHMEEAKIFVPKVKLKGVKKASGGGC